MRISLRFLFLLNDRMGRFGTVDGKMICRSGFGSGLGNGSHWRRS